MARWREELVTGGCGLVLGTDLESLKNKNDCRLHPGMMNNAEDRSVAACGIVCMVCCKLGLPDTLTLPFCSDGTTVGCFRSDFRTLRAETKIGLHHKQRSFKCLRHFKGTGVQTAIPVSTGNRQIYISLLRPIVTSGESREQDCREGGGGGGGGVLLIIVHARGGGSPSRRQFHWRLVLPDSSLVIQAMLHRSVSHIWLTMCLVFCHSQQ